MAILPLLFFFFLFFFFFLCFNCTYEKGVGNGNRL